MSKLWTLIAILLAVLVILWGVGWPLTRMYFNLANGRSASRALVAELSKEFPKVRFLPGGASYRNLEISIYAERVTDPKKREHIKNWLIRKRNEVKPSVSIDLVFVGGNEGKSIEHTYHLPINKER